MSSATEVDVDLLVATQLQKINQRYTSNRQRLVSVLRSSSKPLTTNQIIEADTELAQSTVYRNLAVLEEAGSVVRIITHDDHARYELAEHLTEHHHHVICSQCGEIADFHLSDNVERTLEASLQEVADQFNFAVDSHRLDLIGTCISCNNDT